MTRRQNKLSKKNSRPSPAKKTSKKAAAPKKTAKKSAAPKKTAAKKKDTKKKVVKKGAAVKASAKKYITNKEETNILNEPVADYRAVSHVIVPRRRFPKRDHTIAIAAAPVARPDNIPEAQWDLPIGIESGEFTTLADLTRKRTTNFSLAALSGEDKKKLIIKRIEDTPNYPVRNMLGVGVVDKEKAIAEVKANTAAGRFIAESEQKVIQMMIDRMKDTI